MNWIKTFLELNSDLAKKVVRSRGRFHIAHDIGNGKTEWNFTGAPCHYLDGDEWKPIDTKLVLIGDEYGAAGLRTRIKPDGSVRIIDDASLTLHAQKSVRVGTFNPDTKTFNALKTLPVGEVIDDSIVRSIGNFTHKLTLTETGLREHLVINSAISVPDNIWLVIETELASKQLFPDGWLGDTTIAGHQFPAPHGWDSSIPRPKELPLKRYARFTGGKQYVYTGINSSSLADVVYPVTIDPDYLDSTNDGYIYANDASYSTARSTSSGHDTATNNFHVGQTRLGEDPDYLFSLYRAFLKFPDTADIPDGDIVIQVNLKMVCIGDYSATDFDIQIVKQDWTNQDPLSAVNREGAYDNCLAGVADDNIWRNTSGMSINTQYASGNLNCTWVNKTGATYYSLRSSRDKNADEPTGDEYIQLASQEHATAAYRPILTVVCEVTKELADSATLSDAITILFGKEVAESISITDVMAMLVSIAREENISIGDAVTAGLIFFQELADTLTVEDAIDLLFGKEFAEGITLADAITFTVQLAKTETMTISDAIQFFVSIAKSENISLLDEIAKMLITAKTEGITISDLVASYIFRPNKPLQKYGTRMLIDIYLDSGTKRISTEDLYVQE